MILKRRTSQNIVWGGIAGCMPVLIGWSAVTNSMSWAAVILFLVIFFWTPPHYWPLSMKVKDDYARVGVPMLPVVASNRVVARQIVFYSWVMVGVSLLLDLQFRSSETPTSDPAVDDDLPGHDLAGRDDRGASGRPRARSRP